VDTGGFETTWRPGVGIVATASSMMRNNLYAESREKARKKRGFGSGGQGEFMKGKGWGRRRRESGPEAGDRLRHAGARRLAVLLRGGGAPCGLVFVQPTTWPGQSLALRPLASSRAAVEGPVTAQRVLEWFLGPW